MNWNFRFSFCTINCFHRLDETLFLLTLNYMYFTLVCCFGQLSIFWFVGLQNQFWEQSLLTSPSLRSLFTKLCTPRIKRARNCGNTYHHVKMLILPVQELRVQKTTHSIIRHTPLWNLLCWLTWLLTETLCWVFKKGTKSRNNVAFLN